MARPAHAPFRMLGTTGACFMAAVLCAGCLNPLAAEVGPSESVPRTRPVVVAIIDQGINPYHEAFAREDEGLERFLSEGVHNAANGMPPRLVSLAREGTLHERFSTDAEAWASFQRETLYHFHRTNLLAISFYRWETNERVLYDEGVGHGSAVASALLALDPTVAIVMIETSVSLCGERLGPCIIDPDMVDAMEWAAAQPWIDVISISAGLHLNLPDPLLLRFAEASRAAVTSGKVFLNSAGNEPTVSYADVFAGPPWVISVGGAVNSTRGSVVLASRTPDVVSDYVMTVAEDDTIDGYQTGGGTSVASPRVAAVLARAIADVRRAWGHDGGIVDGALAVGPKGERLTSGDLRRALNASATYWETTEWNPANFPSNSTLYNAAGATTPVLPAAFAQMGWGFVDSPTAGDIRERILAGDFDVPPSKSVAGAYMAQTYAAREAYWRLVLG